MEMWFRWRQAYWRKSFRHVYDIQKKKRNKSGKEGNTWRDRETSSGDQLRRVIEGLGFELCVLAGWRHGKKEEEKFTLRKGTELEKCARLMFDGWFLYSWCRMNSFLEMSNQQYYKLDMVRIIALADFCCIFDLRMYEDYAISKILHARISETLFKSREILKSCALC